MAKNLTQFETKTTGSNQFFSGHAAEKKTLCDEGFAVWKLKALFIIHFTYFSQLCWRNDGEGERRCWSCLVLSLIILPKWMRRGFLCHFQQKKKQVTRIRFLLAAAELPWEWTATRPSSSERWRRIFIYKHLSVNDGAKKLLRTRWEGIRRF